MSWWARLHYSLVLVLYVVTLYSPPSLLLLLVPLRPHFFYHPSFYLPSVCLSVRLSTGIPPSCIEFHHLSHSPWYTSPANSPLCGTIRDWHFCVILLISLIARSSLYLLHFGLSSDLFQTYLSTSYPHHCRYSTHPTSTPRTLFGRKRTSSVSSHPPQVFRTTGFPTSLTRTHFGWKGRRAR